jgi:hypothetical protein
MTLFKIGKAMVVVDVIRSMEIVDRSIRIDFMMGESQQYPVLGPFWDDDLTSRWRRRFVGLCPSHEKFSIHRYSFYTELVSHRHHTPFTNPDLCTPAMNAFIDDVEREISEIDAQVQDVFNKLSESLANIKIMIE